ncbi:carbohydrate-binding protein [Aureimonas mangrovi]|uniref:carbohydrate-binding protein n=1 Tax=Aureimonas mangrovi TaxID=2758041 RepID=UPI00163DC092|nr:carbohydrate-binding protein [Aureimonas mangrovi]
MDNLTDLQNLDSTSNGAGTREEFLFHVAAAFAGRHRVTIDYANGWSDERSLLLQVGALDPMEIAFPSTQSWSGTGQVVLDMPLDVGPNTLCFSGPSHTSPTIRAVAATLLGGERKGAKDDESAIVLIQNIAAIASLEVLRQISQAEAAETEGVDAAIDLSSAGEQGDGDGAGGSDGARSAGADERAVGSGSPLTEALGSAGSVPNGGLPTGFVELDRIEVALSEGAPASAPAFASRSAPPTMAEGPFAFAAQAVDDESVPPSADEETPDDDEGETPATPEPQEPAADAEEPNAEDPGTDEPAVVEPAAFTPLRLQAESAVLGNSGGNVSGNPTVVTVQSASPLDVPNAQAADGGGYVDFAGFGSDNNAGSGQYIQWTFAVDADGFYDIDVGYAFSAANANRSMRMDVNGELWDRIFDMRSTGANTTYSEASTRVFLTAGDNTIRLTANGFSGPNIDYLDVRKADPNVFVFQAEDLVPAATATTPLTANRPVTPDFMANKNATTGGTNEQFRVGAEGEAFLDWGGADAFVDFTFTAPAAGTYTVSITYANGDGANNARPLELVNLADGSQVGQFAFIATNNLAQPRMPSDVSDIDPTPGVANSSDDANTPAVATGWEAWTTETITLTLAAGTTTLRLTSLGTQVTGPNIDKIVVALVEDEEPPVVENGAPTALAATAQTNEDNSVAIDLSAFIDDPDGDALTLTASVPAAQGTVSVAGSIITYVPAADFNGAATISYTVTDPSGASASSSVAVTVNPVNDAPTLDGTIADTTLPAGGGEIDLSSLVAADVDGDPLTLELRSATGDPLPAGISLVAGKVVVAAGTPAGAYGLEIVASDGTLLSGAVGFELTIEPAVIDPEPGAFSPFVRQGETFTIVPDGNSVATDDTLIRTRTQNLEQTPSPTPPPGYGTDGLRPGYTGEGYLDINGTGTGVRATFDLDVPAGTYVLHVRLANGGTGATTSPGFNRPIAVVVNGAQQGEAQTTNTGGFDVWQVRAFTVTLTGEGPFTIGIMQMASGGAPNIDAIAITEVGGEPSFFVPVFTSAATVTYAENGTAPVIDIDASDADGNTLTYSLTAGGADNSLFAIDPVTGVLSFKASPDFENPASAAGSNVYTVEVAVSDGWSTVAQSITVTVTDVDEAPPAENSAPVITSEPIFVIPENSLVVGSVVATDANADALTFALSGADADLFTIDATGAIAFKAAADFEAPGDADGDGTYEVTVTVGDGATSVTQDISITVSDVDEAPGAITFAGTLSLPENAAAGTVIGTLSSVDPEGAPVTFTVDDDRFVINAAGQIVVAEGAVFDFAAEPELSLSVVASDGTQTTTRALTLAVTDVVEPVGPTSMLFDVSTLTSYSAQDNGPGTASVSQDGASLDLGGNLWKRAPLGQNYTITSETKLTVTVTIGQYLPEIIAIGFDDDNSPFEMSDRSVYQIAGSQGQASFVDLRGGAIGTPGQVITLTIDLSAHAGKTINSLVFVADDDVASNGLGSVSFSAVQLSEGAGEPVDNRAPSVVGGGIADLTLPERSAVEIDLPFVDADGDALTYTVTITDADGNVVAGASGLTVIDGTLAGPLGLAPSTVPYVVTVTADDGRGGTASVEFRLTVEDVNDAPTLVEGMAYEPFFGRIGQEIEGIDLALFADAFTDADGDTLTLSVEGLPAGLTVNEEGVIVGTPTGTGDGTITIVATDPFGLRAELVLDFTVSGPQIGEVTTVQAEAFTGLSSAIGFYAAAAVGASGNQIIRTNANQTGEITTDLSANGVSEGWYTVSITVYDETDGSAVFTLTIGDTVLAENVSFDAPGMFLNPTQPRGDGAQTGNLKTITFQTPVFIEPGTLASLTGRADGGEFLRIDKLSFTRAPTPELAPGAPQIDNASVAENAAGAVIGLLSATDPDGDPSAIVYTVDDARFVVDGATLRLADGVALDHEAADTVTVSVTATDAQGLSTTSELTITVGDVDEAPVLAAGAGIDDLTLTAGTTQTLDLAALLGATDPEGAAVSYIALSGGAALPSGITVEDGQLVVASSLPVGTYEITVFASDGALDSESVSFTLTVAEPGTEEPFALTIQAEDGVLTILDNDANDNDTTVRDPSNPENSTNTQLVNGLRPGFTGTGYLDFGDTAGDKASYTFTAPTAGVYEIAIRYATNSNRPLDFVVNGGTAIVLPFVATGTNVQGPGEGFNNWGVQTISVTLAAGENTISIAIPAGANTGPNVDSITITGQGGVPDTSADEDGNLFLSGPDGPLTGAALESINFNLAGIDLDIVKVEISFDGGVTRTLVNPDADGDLVADGSGLTAGNYTATVYVTDDAGNVASSSMPIVVGGVVQPPFSVTVEGESFTPIDNTGTAAELTQARTATNPETRDLPRDANGDGLWDGFTGTGYMDMGTQIGDAASFTVDAPTAGAYTFSFRYSNGGGGANGDRPMSLTVGGQTVTVSFPGTGVDAWDNWQTATVTVNLAAGSNTVTISNTVANGPNIDNVTVSREGSEPIDTREQIRFEEVVKINFQPAPGQAAQGLPSGYVTPDGYLADIGAAFGDRGNGFSYGWVTEASVADGTGNGTIAAAQPANAHWYKNTVPGASDLQKTYAHFEYPGAGAAGARAWEMALENGTYQITLSIGDTAGAFDSNYVINIEGESALPSWVPANPIDGSQGGGGFRSTLVTKVVTVTDGRLTIDSIGGTNTEIQYLEVERVPDITPDDGRSADLDFSQFVAPMAANNDGQVSLAIGANGELPVGIDPTSFLVVGVNLQADGNRGPNIKYVENIKLVETLTGVEVAIDVQISGGADSLTIRPLQMLKENTSYTLKVQDVMDLGSIEDPNGALRQFQDLTTTFVTGTAPEEVARDVAFTTNVILNGFADGAGGFTTIEFGPDGKLYVATITGEVHRWEVNPDGTIDKASIETLSLDYLNAGGGERRGIVGFVFDPNDPNTIWISDNAPIPRENKAFDTPEFSGRISKITLGEDGSFAGATAETYISGLPRSGGDHLTNSLEFRKNPDFGTAGEPEYLLYVSQGSNSAAGQADGAWGNRPERLLNASILEIDPTRDAPAGGYDVRTEPVTAPTTTNPLSAFNPDGTYPGFYNPYAADAVLKIFATGVRNAYDLVWHSNGNLYVPTNGTAAGGRTPDDPTQPGSQVITNSPKQYDYFFTVDEGKYYGHPNALHGEYILNGGNPTSGADPHEVVGGNDGNPNTNGYAPGTQVDPNYDFDGVYNLGYNRSPNGAIEYMGNAFGSNLTGAILFAQFSVGDNVRMIQVDASGKIIADDVLRRPDGSIIDNYIDPLDIIENPATGQLYLMTLNRGTGASQLILLTPAPGGVTTDDTADVGNDLALVPVDVTDPSAAVFQVNGLDDDITAIRVSFNGGPATTVTLNAQNRFTIDLGAVTGAATGTIVVTDDALNTASANVSFTVGELAGELVNLVTIQAEDRTPGDGTAVTIATGTAAQIQIRDAINPELNGSGPGYINGLRPGAFGTDGNTDNSDGVPGGYADFGSTNADFITFTFQVPSDQAGSAVLRFRYSNGATADRPLQLEVNGSIVKIQSFAPTATGAVTDGWTVWAEVEVPVALLGGQNTVTLRSINATGPNIDQMEVLVPAERETFPNDGEVVVDGTTYLIYEAEKAELDGAAIVTENRNQTGGAFVDFVGTADQSIVWTVSVSQAGTYGIDILYALGAGKAARPMTVSVDGGPPQTLPFVANSNGGETLWGPQSFTLDLAAGTHTITLVAPAANGPNVDSLRITKEPVSVFEPDPAEITGEGGRIELEATDGSANTINGSTVDFYFTVDTDRIYKLDVAANAGAPNGQGLTWFLNGVAIDDSAFPGVGVTGETSIYVELTAGTQYQLRIVSDAPGASGIDYLDVQPAPGNPNADILVESLDPAFFADRLHFSYLENPGAVVPADPRDYKDTGSVRLTNTGTEPLEFIDFELTGPFVLANPAILDGLVLAAGQSIDVQVNFNRAAYTPPTTNVDATSTIFEGVLTIVTNDAGNPVSKVQLSGFWQARDEGGQEPNVNEIWKIFGFGNVIEGLTLSGGGENSVLSTNDVFAKTDETEVLSPYWRIADGATSATITQIAAFHGPGGATLHIHNPGNKGANVQFWNHQGNDNQRLLPNAGNDATFATRTFDNATIPDGWVGNEVFGISVAGLSTDPRLNPTGGVIVPGAQQGHTVKMFQALDAKGNVIPNVYLGIMDYTGINYDYNDNLFIIEGVEPVGFGQNLVVTGLDDAAADDRLVFTSIDQPASATQAFRNEATFTITNDGFAPLAIAGIDIADAAAFEIVGTIPTSIAAGASATITVRFIGTHAGTAAGADLYKSTLTIRTDDISNGVQVIQLAGLAQEFSENNSEPTVAQIVEAFGYGTDVAQGELAGGGLVETIGDEVLMPYLERLDGTKPIEIIQIAAFLNQGNVARLGFHGLGSSQVTNLFANDDQQGQTVLPDQLLAGPGAGASVARGTINVSTPFGLYISVDGRPTYSSWTDPNANRIDPNFGQLVNDQQGHLIRFFQALDADGNVIEGTYIGIQDYPGAGNYDYNDHMFVVKNVRPHALTAAEDANGNGVNDALEKDTDNDGTVDFFDPNTTTPPVTGPQAPYGGTAPSFTNGALTVDASFYDTGGQGVAYNDNPGKDGGTNFRPGDGVEFVGPGNDIGHVLPGEWVEYTINVPASGLYTFVANAKTPVTGATIAVSLAGGQTLGTVALADGHAGGSNFGSAAFANSAPITISLPSGPQTLRLTFDGPLASNGYVLDLASFTMTQQPGSAQAPYGGTAPSFTNGALTVDASFYDTGGQGVAYNDNPGKDGGTNFRPGDGVEFVGPGNDIGHVLPGEWVEYTINVPASGLYTFVANAKTPVTGATIAVSLAGGQTLGTVALADGHAGGSNFGSAAFANSTPITISLPSGPQTLRLTFDGPLASNGYVLDLASFTMTQQPGSAQTPFGGTPHLVDADGLTLSATAFDNGGQGVAYNDTTPAQLGTNAVRPGTAVDIVAATSSVGWIANGEWIEYTISVEEAGFYDVSFLTSRGDAAGSRSIVTTFEQNGVIYRTAPSVAIGFTGGWDTFAESEAARVELNAGVQTVRLAFNGGAMDLQSISIEKAPLAPAAMTTTAFASDFAQDDPLDAFVALIADDGSAGVDDTGGTPDPLFHYDLVV